MDRPILLCALGNVGWTVLEYLRAAGLPAVTVDLQCPLDDARLLGVPLIRGDFRRPDVLEQAGVRQAGGVLILSSDDLINVSAALAVRRLNPEVRIVVRMFNENLLSHLGKTVSNVFALSTSTLTAPLFALTALTGQALGTFRLDDQPEGRRQVVEMTVASASPLRDQSIAGTVARSQALVLAHLRDGGAQRFLHDVEPEERLRTGDRLVVCGEPHRLSALETEAEAEVAPEVVWAGKLRRLGRIAWRTLTEVERPVLICAAVFLAVVTVSTLVLYLWAERQTPAGTAERFTPARAFLRTVGIMATVADLGEKELKESWSQVFVSVLRIVGALLMAAFTALVTNYLLRARLGGVLEIRRIPDRGHVIICGLGNVGFRILQELVQAGERVVVIEILRDGRFVATARRLGAAVLTGDATVREVLRQAHAAQARAVIAATSNDLINLEVALLVRDLDRHIRVVMRLYDSALAETLRTAANVRYALSVPALVAPAFVAALFGDRILSVFLIEGRLVAVVELLTAAQDSFLAGQSVRAVAIDYRLLPLAVLDAAGGPPRPSGSARLAAGDRLIAIMALSDLERLRRREPVPRDWAVDVTAFPLPARSWLALRLRQTCGLDAEAAEKAVDQLPACLGTDLTRGQAEELFALLQRERITARLRRAGSVPDTEKPLPV
jgi:Trk K+ transport system NAD-binding subunit